MTAAFFMIYALFVGLFFFLFSWFWIKDVNVDCLNPSVWKAFALLLPFLLIVSLKAALFFALVIIAFQLIGKLIPYLPNKIKRFCEFSRACLVDFLACVAFLGFFRKRCWNQVLDCYPGKGKIPILLIHGYRHEKGAWIYHAPRLSQEGWGPLYTYDLGSSYQTIEQYSQLTEKKIQEILKSTGAHSIVIIGYSMGGLIAADYILNKAVPNSIKALITLATPFEGTKLAVLGYEPCALQMHYRNPYLLDLKAKIAQVDFPFIQLGSSTDNTVIPSSSCFVTANCETIEGIGHLEMLYSEQVTQKLSEALKRILDKDSKT